MPAPSSQEFLREQSAVQAVAQFYGYEIEKLQQAGADDFGADAILVYRDFMGEQFVRLEVRAKGFENHAGKVCAALRRGWNSSCLKDGITINRRTVEAGPFWFAVKFPRWKLRVAQILSNDRMNFLLAQPHRIEVSTNSKTEQVVCRVPISWFEVI
ncbi:MAG: hypothetical protein WAU89_17985 [Candidatus Acidiferrales bacterium]